MFIGAALVINAVPFGFSVGMLLCRLWIPAEVVQCLFETLLASSVIAVVLRGIDLFLSRYEKSAAIDRAAPPAV